MLPLPRRIPATTPLAAFPVVPTKVHVPRPMEMRLEEMATELMRRASDLGNVTHGDVVGSLMLARKADAKLVADLRIYRNATVGDALPGRAQITLSARRRGRPPIRRG